MTRHPPWFVPVFLVIALPVLIAFSIIDATPAQATGADWEVRTQIAAPTNDQPEVWPTNDLALEDIFSVPMGTFEEHALIDVIRVPQAENNFGLQDIFGPPSGMSEESLVLIDLIHVMPPIGGDMAYVVEFHSGSNDNKNRQLLAFNDTMRQAGNVG